MHLTTGENKALVFYPPFFNVAFLRLLFEPRDLWIGIYWDRGINGSGIKGDFITLYITIIPTLVIKLDLWFKEYRWPNLRHK